MIQKEKAKERGGLARSRVDWYHLSFSSSQPSKVHLPSAVASQWVRIEEQLVYPFSVEAFDSQTNRPIPSPDLVMSFARES